MQHVLTDQNRAFVLVALIADRSEAKALLPFLPAEEQEVLNQTLDSLLEKTSNEKRNIILNELKSLAVESQRSILAEVHPDWILAALQKESPRTIAAILRYLPGEHVDYILDKLPQPLLKSLPSLSETFAIDPELVKTVRKAFESQFAHPPLTNSFSSHRSFDEVCLLSALKLKMLFCELGLREMAYAFRTLKKNTIDVLSRRLGSREALALKAKLNEAKEISEERLTQAQNHLVSINIEKRTGEVLFLEIGFFIFSKAPLPEHSLIGKVIEQKFPINMGGLLKKYIEKNKSVNSERMTRKYQKEVIEALTYIEDQGH